LSQRLNKSREVKVQVKKNETTPAPGLALHLLTDAHGSVRSAVNAATGAVDVNPSLPREQPEATRSVFIRAETIACELVSLASRASPALSRQANHVLRKKSDPFCTPIARDNVSAGAWNCFASSRSSARDRHR
jgi:hypothetical protein